ncbi:MAG: D-glutamate cyclase family protein [Mycobacterium sp.]
MTLRVASTAAADRARMRAGEHTGPTSGLAPGFAQANLVILPADEALDFLRFCVRNPKPCPLLEVTDTGSPHPAGVATDADLRTDLPRYRVFQDGQLVDEPTDIAHIGHPTQLGIDDLAAPDFGDAVRVGADEVPVFWACGVTPQAVAIEARPSLAIFHAPGHMFITDKRHVVFDNEEGHDHP